MIFAIRCMYGKAAHIARFGFYSDGDDAAERFDTAVHEINRIYHENGRYQTREDVVKHFASYGFTEVRL